MTAKANDARQTEPTTTTIEVLYAAQMYTRSADKDLADTDRQIRDAMRRVADDTALFDDCATASGAFRVASVISTAEHLRELYAKRRALIERANTLREIIGAAGIATAEVR